MAIAETVGRLGRTLLAMLQTRLELAAVELEEEGQRWLGYLMLALLAMLLFGIALALVALFIVILFWDSHRLEAVGALALVFALGGAAVALALKASLARKPRLLGASVAELAKDVHMIGGAHE